MQPDEPIIPADDPPAAESPAVETESAPIPEGVPSGKLRETRKEAAMLAKDKFDRARDRHQITYKMAMTEYQQADAAIEAKQDAETQFGVRISMTMDVEGNWWFQ